MEMEQLHFVGKSFNGQTLSTGTKKYVIHGLLFRITKWILYFEKSIKFRLGLQMGLLLSAKWTLFLGPLESGFRIFV